MKAARPRPDHESDGDAGMMPMIDLIFLLLIFFLLTMTFVPEECILDNVLPTDGSYPTEPDIIDRDEVHLKIYPAGFAPGLQPSDYDRAWRDGYRTDRVVYQIGNRRGIEVAGAGLDGGDEATDQVVLASIHEHIHAQLQDFEVPGARRRDQQRVVIHGFTGLPWKYVAAAYDAVREWEHQRGAEGSDHPEAAVRSAREVVFAPPRVRAYRDWEMGAELYEIVHLK